jgi:hypothetical protein
VTSSWHVPHSPAVPLRAPPYTPLQVLFLTRLAHLVALCYHARQDSSELAQRALVLHALRSTIDDCFEAGLAPELLRLLAEGSLDA